MRSSIPSNLGILHSLLWILQTANAKTYGWNHAPVQKDSPLVSENFRDVSVELLSPAFADPETINPGWSNGTQGPTSHETLEHFVSSIVQRNEWASLHIPDFKSEEGRTLPLVFLSSSSQSPDRPGDNAGQKLRVWIQGAIHGNEPAADQAALALLGKLDANQTWAAALLEKLDILLLPRYNADGVAYFQRELASNLDPNRDHTKLARQQTRDIKKIVGAFSPHIVVDLHEFTGTFRAGNYIHGVDSLLSYGRNLNVHKDIRSLTRDLFIENIGASLEEHGLRWEWYVTGSRWDPTPGSEISLQESGIAARTGMGAYGLLQTVTILLETRGIRLADQHFQRRVATQLVKISSILETAAFNFDHVYSTLERAAEEFINSDDDIVVTEHGVQGNRTFTFVDTTNGSIVQVPVRYTSTQPSVANLTRTRPEGYVIPRTYTDLVSRLSDSGVEVETLPDEFRGPVEVLNITSVRFGDGYDEGTVPVTVTTETYRKEILLPAGSFWVSTRQKYAGLAFATLEPESRDGYVTFGILPVAVGSDYPVFRVPRD